MSTSQESQTTVSSDINTSEVRSHFHAFVDRWQAKLDDGVNPIDAFLQSAPDGVMV
jgi:hypothetical protein